MKAPLSLLVVLTILLIAQGCNTLYQVKLVDLEVVEPGKIKIPEKFSNIAVRYNNANVAYNPRFAEYYRNEKNFTENYNLDSTASFVYYEMFLNNLKSQVFFDTITELEQNDFSNTKIIFDKKINETVPVDSLLSNSEFVSRMALRSLGSLIQKFPVDSSKHEQIHTFDKDFGLYSSKDLQHITDTTGADLFLSLDYFAVLDGIKQIPGEFLSLESVYIISHWNFYDLQTKKLRYFYNRVDTVSWEKSASNLKQAVKLLPPRRDAVLNAADISGSRFVEFLVPHWVGVQRIYYKSGHIELKQTSELIEQGKWKEAARIWKKHIDNPNKKIAAKCMFNLGLACEIEGDIDAAIDWVVRSYHLLERKYEVHDFHCTDYIKILSLRKRDIKILDQQF